jgi:hypothetical protein
VPAAPDVANGTAATLDEAKAKFSDGAVPTGGAPTPRLGQGGQKGALRWDCRRDLHREPFKGADHRNQDRHAVGSIDMTKEQAIEACAKAILRSMGHREIGWEKSDAKDFATKLVTCLEALDLLSKTPFE